jgi:sarcosine oxidase/L-pipecolate oxidase
MVQWPRRQTKAEYLAPPSSATANIPSSPNGDFIVSYHPEYEGLFLATGGSGHAYKFFPVIGDKVVDALEGTLEPGFRDLWTWNEVMAPGAATDDIFDGDGSRSGARDLILKDELAKTKKAARKSVL